MKRGTLVASLSMLGLIAMAMASFQWLQGTQDINIYGRIGGDATSIDADAFESEYPPMASALFGFIHTITGREDFPMGWFIFVIVAIVITTAYAARALDDQKYWLLPLSLVTTVVLLGADVFFARFDILLFLLLFLSWRAHRGKQFAESAFWLLLASALKAVPLVLFPLLWFTTEKSQRRAILRGALGGLAVSVLFPAIIMGLPRMLANVLFVVGYHGERLVQIESTWSAIDLLLRHLSGIMTNTAFDHLSVVNMDLGRGTLLLAAAASLAAVFAVTAFTAEREPGSLSFGTASTIALLLLLFLSPVFSPQYLLWVLPMLFAITYERFAEKSVPTRRESLLLLITALMALVTHWIFPLHYGQLVDQTWMSVIVLLNLRNIALLLTAIILWRDAWGLPPLRPRKMRTSAAETFSSRIAGPTVLLMLGVIALWALQSVSMPTPKNMQYYFEGGERVDVEFPFFVSPDGKRLTVEFDMTLSQLHPAHYVLKPDDCIESMTINGTRLDAGTVEFCDYGVGKNVDIGRWLQPGNNHVLIEIGDTGGVTGMQFFVSPRDPLFLTILILFGLLFLWYAHRLADAFQWTPAFRWLSLWLFVGGALRFLYTLTTPYNVRDHEGDAHLEYVQYVGQHWNIPPAQVAWEYHQAPLYYFLAAAWASMGNLLERSAAVLARNLQWLSSATSTATLVVGAWIGRMLFPGRREWPQALLFSALLAVFPALIYTASGVTNEGLYNFFAFLGFAFLLRFWRSARMSDWYVCLALISIASITKISGYALIPAAFTCFFVRFAPRLKSRLLHVGLSVLLLFFIAGWLPIVRLREPQISRALSIGNEGMGDGLRVKNTVRNFLIFHPVKVVEKPYNNTWTDESRRQYFWEFLYRSMFFGEYGFPDHLRRISQVLLALGIAAFIPFFWGLWTSVRDRFMQWFPLLVTTGFLLLSILLYRLRFPYAPNQDFRFVELLAVPIAAYTVEGAFKLPRPLRQFSILILVGLITGGLTFFLKLAWGE